MTIFSGKNKAKKLAIFILMVGFLLTAPTTARAQQVLLNNYNKAINGTLTHTEWNNLLTDFLNRNGTAQLNGDLIVGSWPSPQGSLTINGPIVPNSGISAGYIFSGNFGQHTGGGDYSFPGNLGIGTTSPAFELSVVGDINFTGSLLQNGNPFLGSRWSLHSNGNDIFYNTGNVIVGAAESTTRLHVETNSGPVAFFKSNLYGGTYAGYIGNMQTFSLEEFGLYTIPNYRLAAFDQTNGLYLYGGFSDTDVGISIDSLSNNVGIGTTTPAYKLDVAGDVNFTGDLFQNGVLFNAGGSNLWTENGANIFNNNTGNVGIGVSNPTIARLQISALTNTEGLRLISSNYSPLVIRNTADTSDLLRLNQAGKLEIASAIKIASTTETCDATQSGTFKYDSISGQSYLCDGKRWLNQKNCGLMTDNDSNTYGTVQIGGQCWMAENINVGIMLASAATMPNTTDQVIEKWCYNNSAANCAAEGGLYHWDEAMRGSQVAGAQGICPSGWHVPTDAEYNILEKTVLGVIASTNPQYVCDLSYSGWQRCADNTGNDQGANGVGQALIKVGLGSGVGTGKNLVGFSANFPGRRNTDGSFYSRGSTLLLWSSTPSGSNAWRRGLSSTYSTVFRNAYNKAYGFSVRCLRD